MRRPRPGAALGAALTLALCCGGCATAPRAPHIPAQALPRPSSAIDNAPAAAPIAADMSTVMVERAIAMLGQPYRFGGAEPGGFDCSGLVSYAAAGAGIQLPRTTREQLRAGVAIERQNIRAADLVFMRLSRKELHVGIAIDGIRFVHSPSSGGNVRIDSLAAAPYSRGFLAARRIADAPAPAALPVPPAPATLSVVPAPAALPVPPAPQSALAP